MDDKHQLALATDTLLEDGAKYRRLVGKLIYLTLTRLDISYSVHILSQFMQKPTTTQWEAALRVVRYLKGHPGQGVVFRADSALKLEAYCDAAYASCPITRRSITAYFVCLGGSPISWKTKKQAIVSLSSTEAEYRAMTAATCEILWLTGLLAGIGIHFPEPVRLHCDNQSAMHIANNPVYHERTKHIEIDCHFIRTHIRNGVVLPCYIHTQSQLADILTKALGRPQFKALLDKLGISDSHAPT
ncbi:secreted RxLR effector protein 161-like [Silene latifolia]|uniref:secreted RxLR effector protein 161-like n=1 Tax=Silene latifolia TaxID=37657 RepID=UPI003D76B15D